MSVEDMGELKKALSSKNNSQHEGVAEGYSEQRDRNRDNKK